MPTMSHVKRSIFALAVITGFAANSAPSNQSATHTDGASRKEFQDFSSLRSEVLSMIGGATKRVWIATDFLSDAEIVSSLYIAQYRKINISVLIGKDRATNILSRLNYLKQVNIPVSLRPKNFYAQYPSILLIDNKLYGLTATLDYMLKTAKLAVEPLSADQLSSFEDAFADAAKLMNAPNMAPLPQVGRSRPNARYYKPSTTSSQTTTPATGERSTTIPADTQRTPKAVPTASPIANTPNSGKNPDSATGTVMGGGAYRYKATREKPSEGVPTRLPRTTLRQELERERQRLRERDRDDPSTAE